MSEFIFYNGNIITMEEDLHVQAVMIKGEKIFKVGTKEEIFLNKSENTTVVDLNGKTLMPSFIDAHSHITAFAATLGLVQLTGMSSYEEIVDKIKKHINDKNIKKGEWVIGFGYDHNDLKEKAHPTKDILDRASDQNPIMITHASGHMGVINSLALKELKITSESKDPEGGLIGREKDSREPNGYLEENAFINQNALIPAPSIEKILNQLVEAQNIYLSYGITTAQDGMMKREEFSMLKALADNKKLAIDVVGYVDLKRTPEILTNNKKYLMNYVDNFKIGGYKIFLDGSPQGKTAWLTEPYEGNNDGYRGYPAFKDEEVKEFIQIALKNNLQLLTHANGDAAGDQLIYAFKEMLGDEKSKTRPVMIHAQTLRYDQIDEMKRIGMMPSFFVAHTYYWGDTHIKNLGEERAFRISPVKETIDKGVPYTFHQDTPVILPDMLFTVWTAVNRITKEGAIIGENERISPLDALKGVTINAAFQYFEEDLKGSIKEGKFADLIVLDKDPLTINPMEIKDIKVLETYKKGRLLYKK